MEYYFSGLLLLLTGLLIWFYSPIRSSIGYLLFSKSIKTNDEFETALLFKSPFLGKLLGCYICTSFWGSLLIGIALWWGFDLPNFFPFLAWFTYPSIAYLYKKILDY